MNVLIIDDNSEITEMISFYLESQNISCHVVNDGKGGLDTIKSKHFDAVIMDLAMPEFSGYDIFYALKKENLLDKNNIIIFTASSILEDDVNRLVNEGAKAVIKKPLSLDELTEVLDRFRGNNS